MDSFQKMSIDAILNPEPSSQRIIATPAAIATANVPTPPSSDPSSASHNARGVVNSSAFKLPTPPESNASPALRNTQEAANNATSINAQAPNTFKPINAEVSVNNLTANIDEAPVNGSTKANVPKDTSFTIDSNVLILPRIADDQQYRTWDKMDVAIIMERLGLNRNLFYKVTVPGKMPQPLVLKKPSVAFAAYSVIAKAGVMRSHTLFKVMEVYFDIQKKNTLKPQSVRKALSNTDCFFTTGDGAWRIGDIGEAHQPKQPGPKGKRSIDTIEDNNDSQIPQSKKAKGKASKTDTDDDDDDDQHPQSKKGKGRASERNTLVNNDTPPRDTPHEHLPDTPTDSENNRTTALHIRDVNHRFPNPANPSAPNPSAPNPSAPIPSLPASPPPSRRRRQYDIVEGLYNRGHSLWGGYDDLQGERKNVLRKANNSQREDGNLQGEDDNSQNSKLPPC